MQGRLVIRGDAERCGQKQIQREPVVYGRPFGVQEGLLPYINRIAEQANPTERGRIQHPTGEAIRITHPVIDTHTAMLRLAMVIANV